MLAAVDCCVCGVAANWLRLRCGADSSLIIAVFRLFSAFSRPSRATIRIHKLVEQLSPLLTDKNVTSAIHELPKGIRLVATIVDTLGQKEVKQILDNGLPVRDVLRDHGDENMRRFIGDALRSKLPEDQTAAATELLVNASLNLVGLSSFSRKYAHLTPREILCDIDRLGDIILLNNQSMLGVVMDALCGKSRLSVIFNVCQRLTTSPQCWTSNKTTPCSSCCKRSLTSRRLSSGSLTSCTASACRSTRSSSKWRC